MAEFPIGGFIPRPGGGIDTDGYLSHVSIWSGRSFTSDLLVFIWVDILLVYAKFCRLIERFLETAA